MSVLLFKTGVRHVEGTCLQGEGHPPLPGSLDHVIDLFRPSGSLQRTMAIIMHDGPDAAFDPQCPSGYLHAVTPQGPLSRHDRTWLDVIATSIACHGPALSPDAARAEVAAAGHAYWFGRPHRSGPAWEYLAPSAIVREHIPRGRRPEDVILRLSLSQDYDVRGGMPA